MKATGLGFQLPLDKFCILLGADGIAVRQTVDKRRYYFQEYDIQMDTGMPYAAPESLQEIQGSSSEASGILKRICDASLRISSLSDEQHRSCKYHQQASEDREDVCSGAAGAREGDSRVVQYFNGYFRSVHHSFF